MCASSPRMSVMPYAARARGVDPPLWSRAAMNPGAEAMRSRWSSRRVRAAEASRDGAPTAGVAGEDAGGGARARAGVPGVR